MKTPGLIERFRQVAAVHEASDVIKDRKMAAAHDLTLES